MNIYSFYSFHHRIKFICLDQFIYMSMIPRPFMYFSPTTENEALALLKDYKSDAKILAGGDEFNSSDEIKAGITKLYN